MNEEIRRRIKIITSITSSYEREGILVFLGDATETDLMALKNTLHVLSDGHFRRIDYFGNRELGKRFEEAYNIEMNFIGKVDREELIRQYASHALTIAPIFNCNFEILKWYLFRVCFLERLSSASPQPFMEVTGKCEMVANINNPGEMRRKSRIWHEIDNRQRKKIKETILEKMDSERVARDLMTFLVT
ncbi:hypothetical protein GCM10007108_13430 [Thermogymnomonas acidicola]|uniref:Uncharacterized protein n=1 Tax=Thermogymnomonas acidicola TaxID=399579 RepID=A0AA37BT16_9ARCH|nr:hypothetical protein [Thermogymnomonas acidicola]GGM76653.1 hypothetical protein GCM10007108_13430 [Thermogymnomonas acidicola]